MNNLRKLCAGLILTLALTVPAFAGQIECGGVVEPPPPPPEAVVMETTPDDVTVTGEISNGVTDTLLWLIFSLF